MTNPLTIYDTNTLVKVVSNLKKSQNFLLNKFFPNIVEADSELVSIDVDLGKRRIAPFCSPLVEGKVVEQRRYQTNTFKPPYIKDKRHPDLLKPVRRMIGERVGGDMDATARMDANVAMEMEDQIDIIDRRMEWMAAGSMQNGSYTVSGEGFPSTLLDFGRDSSLSVTLTGNYMWDSGNAAATPAQNIDAWGNLILKKSGAVATDLIFSPTAFAYFIKDQSVRDAVVFDTARFKEMRNNLNLGAQPKHGAQYKGQWGSYDLWVYNDWYVDPVTNVETRMIADGTVILAGDQLEGTRAFGLIIDPKFSYQPMAYAPKMWYTEDPAQINLLMQSSPVVIPSRPNACLCATVTNAVQG